MASYLDRNFTASRLEDSIDLPNPSNIDLQQLIQYQGRISGGISNVDQRSFISSDLGEDILTIGNQSGLFISSGFKRQKILLDNDCGSPFPISGAASTGLVQPETFSMSGKSTTASVKREAKFDLKIFDQGLNDEEGQFLPQTSHSSLESAAELRRMKNREAAIKSRQKKQSKVQSAQQNLEQMQKENNVLKLDNAALKAENQVLKRQLNYFENLFAQKQNNEYHNRKDQEAQAEKDVSFVLERQIGNGGTKQGMGLFGLATLMCVCCITVQTQGVSQGDSQASTTQSIGFWGATLQEADGVEAATNNASFLQIILSSLVENMLILITGLAFIFAIALFPKDQLVQWAARKPFLRRFFDFRNVQIGAQTKFVKSDKLI